MNRLFISAILAMACIAGARAANLTVTLNSTTRTMTLINKASGETVEVGEPTSYKYTFQADAGTYLLTGYDSDNTTVNGTIELVVDGNTDFAIQTATVGFSNPGFELGTDVNLELNLKDAEGNLYDVTIGDSKNAGKKTFLVFKNSTSNIDATPSEQRAAEGYQTWQDTRDRKYANNATIWVALSQQRDFTITVPAAAQAQLATKTKDYLPFTPVEPTEVTTQGGNKTYHYDFTLTTRSVTYMFRIWGEGFCTQAGTLSAVAGMQDLVFTADDLTAIDPTYINRDITANSNLNVADVFLNINPQGHLKMQVGDTKDIIALRTWQLTNSTTANMYVDPDYHYTVLNLNGQPDNSVIALERYSTSTDPWTTLTAVGAGTAIVLVTYDAIRTVQIDAEQTTGYYGGEYWSAVWPENTGVFVVTVGDQPTGIHTNMFANAGFNDVEHKLAVDSLDAEHDVIYYLADEGHANYTFTPEGATKVEIAYPVIGEQSVTYPTFQEVIRGDDDSYTLQLKHGRQIVRLTNAQGACEYQVITAKPCTRQITNITHPNEHFRAGDKVSIQYNGLFHPNNKLSRIYNMTAYVAYNGVPAGTSEYGSAGQYTFAAIPEAQLYLYTIADDAEDNIILSDGTIQINGFGDPVGNHRNLSRTEGRVFAGMAPSHKTYLGILPDIELKIDNTTTDLLNPTDTPTVQKILHNTQLLIIRDKQIYNPLGYKLTNFY